MRKRDVRGYVVVALIGAFISGVVISHQVAAQTATSPNYQITESQFGNTSGAETCSDNYCASVSIGDTGRSSTASTPEFGDIEYSEPILEMIVTGGDSDLGQLTTEQTGIKTMSVKVRNHLSGGFMLQIIGDAPTYGDHSLYSLTTPTASRPGSEQFGINVVSNTTPNIGTNPISQPSGQEDVGLLTSNYSTADMFMYSSGDTVAISQTDSGGADFTVTMIVNISNETPAGKYSGDFAAVIFPYF